MRPRQQCDQWASHTDSHTHHSSLLFLIKSSITLHLFFGLKNISIPSSSPLFPHPCRGSSTMARGWVIFPSMRVLRVCEAFSSRATLMVFLGPSSVQYKLSAIQSTAIPSTVWIPETNTNKLQVRRTILGQTLGQLDLQSLQSIDFHSLHCHFNHSSVHFFGGPVIV